MDWPWEFTREVNEPHIVEYEKILARQKEEYDGVHPTIANISEGLAVMYEEKKDYAKAAMYWEQSVKTRYLLLGNQDARENQRAIFAGKRAAKNRKKLKKREDRQAAKAAAKAEETIRSSSPEAESGEKVYGSIME